MARHLITEELSLEQRVFLPDGRGLRGINLLRSSAPRGLALAVAIHTPTGKRLQFNTFSLRGKDFYKQWERAVEGIAERYEIAKEDALYAQMIAASANFIAFYRIILRPVVVTYQEAELASEPAS